MVNVTETKTVYVKRNVTTKEIELTGPTKPLYGQIVIMAVVCGGVLLFMFVSYQQEKQRKRDQLKVGTTSLTDYELKPIEQ